MAEDKKQRNDKGGDFPRRFSQDVFKNIIDSRTAKIHHQKQDRGTQDKDIKNRQRQHDPYILIGGRG
ncbi:hypothetical protein SDC9_212542 [bioreactor metagenome]|uniref:Uncharacterized protein n=1 Tax=bioreactor metagenome TaxID=1076179 RepID=A0A645JM93_9ZZZZ